MRRNVDGLAKRTLRRWLYDLSAIIPRHWSERCDWDGVKHWFNYNFRRKFWLKQQWLQWGEDNEKWEFKD